MSVCRKLPDGTIQKIAGHTILLDANASEVREGTWSMPTSSSTSFLMCNVTFTDPMPDDDYVVVIEADDVTSYQQLTQLMVRNKTTTGFEMRVVVADATFGIMTGRYTAFKPIKLDGYTALQNKVNNPDEVPTENSENLVTSDGVWEAIKNASAVWKGTKAEWNALPAAEKQTYDLAVLLDETLVKAVDREDGTETDVANLNKIFRGTEAEWQALSAVEKDVYDEAVTTGEQNPVAWPFPCPDWSRAYPIQNTNRYVIPDYGIWVQCSNRQNWDSIPGTVNVYCNNVPVGVWDYENVPNASQITLCIPVSKGDVMSASSARGLLGGRFVPWKRA